jgi:PhoPQ-activated pathogenicity-related protein
MGGVGAESVPAHPGLPQRPKRGRGGSRSEPVPKSLKEGRMKKLMFAATLTLVALALAATASAASAWTLVSVDSDRGDSYADAMVLAEEVDGPAAIRAVVRTSHRAKVEWRSNCTARSDYGWDSSRSATRSGAKYVPGGRNVYVSIPITVANVDYCFVTVSATTGSFWSGPKRSATVWLQARYL